MLVGLGPLAIARALVSKNKRRFREDGFDLDLSYITPRIIAMGFPSEGAEGMFRNPLSEVMSFLTKFHAKHFKVFNLCAERPYEPVKLGGNVEWIPFADHNPAPTNVMLYFCERAHDWLSLNSNNVIVVHCKAGKGRTGVMISAYLLYSRDFTDPLSAMQFYGERRTKNGKGVTIPSQRRYITYFHQLLNSEAHSQLNLQLHKVVLIAKFSIKYDIQVRVFSNGGNGSYQLNLLVDSAENGSNAKFISQEKNISFSFPDLWISGDVKIEIYEANSSKKKALFYLWFNTDFIEDNKLCLMSKSELDKPPKNLEEGSQVLSRCSSKKSFITQKCNLALLLLQEGYAFNRVTNKVHIHFSS